MAYCWPIRSKRGVSKSWVSTCFYFTKIDCIAVLIPTVASTPGQTMWRSFTILTTNGSLKFLVIQPGYGQRLRNLWQAMHSRSCSFRYLRDKPEQYHSYRTVQAYIHPLLGPFRTQNLKLAVLSYIVCSLFCISWALIRLYSVVFVDWHRQIPPLIGLVVSLKHTASWAWRLRVSPGAARTIDPSTRLCTDG